MGRIYTVLFQGINSSEAPSRTEFYYDWGQLPDGQYKVTFSFSSSAQTLVGTSVANIYMDLGQFSPIATVNGSQTRIGYLGSLEGSGVGTNKSLTADVDDNPPLYLNTRPYNNRVKINVYENIYPTENVEFNLSTNQFTLCLSLELQNR
jgi:hypothetical protein